MQSKGISKYGPNIQHLCAVTDSHDHDMKLDGLKTSVECNF